ncbi:MULTISPECIES: LytTR family DNA-binding domain-containing protein [unclassified Brevundimonas]|uniref:LytR/AlgR family response regulator transcription factor n=1 Tax=unclassified Brevundimonas TaxID=2622653 RepID=UPI000CFDD0EE|nr:MULTISPECIES: LytTR family DNA-binding domain-containing protein [unclassified Brevundimonas]PRA29119.1 DNA-binding response regulator [Brevundimonas sp. MYb27]PQZ84833.1 DNA-binding response regulator [Brevundimonas sp. MYb31]PRB14575.1 DNA-binding response regulator [Brevundimonas sp. MYb52]PRB36652.1 DNA-binding response regulator [Brevundimonas sp. MYb46]PRB55649.1 DNA-binding response regulator [Brevundimonas sp. MYb33]
MKVLIADDEPLALARLKQALACIPEVELAAAARSGEDALQLIRSLQPDIAVLDIEMPGLDGLGVVSRLSPSDPVPEIIFVTAFTQHAVDAFALNAADYLTKPFEFERLRAAIRRARTRLDARNSDQRFAELQTLVASLQQTTEPSLHETEVWIRRADGLHRQPLEDVDHILAQGDYVELHTRGATYLVRDTISSLEQRIDPTRFVRCHRSVIVNLAFVRGVRRRTGRKLALTLSNGREITVGPSYADRVSQIMNIKPWRQTS